MKEPKYCWLTDTGWRKLCRLVDERDHGRCILCNSSYGLHHHHVVFRSKIHSDREDNLVLLCFKCHDIYAHGKKEKAYQGEFLDYLQNPSTRVWRAAHETALENIYMKYQRPDKGRMDGK